MTTPAEISAYLEVIKQQDGKLWEWHHIEARRYWEVECKKTRPACKLNLELDERCLYLYTTVTAPHVLPECWAAMQYFLLRLNDELPVVKFGLGDDGQISLMAEAAADQVSLSVVKTLLEMTATVFEHHYREITLLATGRELANLVRKPFETLAGPLIDIKVVGTESHRS